MSKLKARFGTFASSFPLTCSLDMAVTCWCVRVEGMEKWTLVTVKTLVSLQSSTCEGHHHDARSGALESQDKVSGPCVDSNGARSRSPAPARSGLALGLYPHGDARSCSSQSSPRNDEAAAAAPSAAVEPPPPPPLHKRPRQRPKTTPDEQIDGGACERALGARARSLSSSTALPVRDGYRSIRISSALPPSISSTVGIPAFVHPPFHSSQQQHHHHALFITLLLTQRTG